MYVRTQLIFARTPDCTGNDDSVIVVGDDWIHHQRIAVLQHKCLELFFVNCGNLVAVAGFAFHSYTASVGISCKTTCHVEQVVKCLSSSKFVCTVSFHFTTGGDKLFVGTDNDHVVVFQTYIRFIFTIQQIVVYIETGDLFAVPVYFYVSQWSDIVYSSCCIKGVEKRGERWECIGPGCDGFADNIDFNAANLPQSDRNECIRLTAVKRCHDFTQFLPDAILCRLDSQSA